MSFLSWMKRRGAPEPPKEDGKTYARDHGHKSIDGLAVEIRQDEALAKQRDATGREPDCVPRLPKPVARKHQPKRERLKGHDIPF